MSPNWGGMTIGDWLTNTKGQVRDFVILVSIYLADRANTGLHIVRLTGEAAKIVLN